MRKIGVHWKFFHTHSEIKWQAPCDQLRALIYLTNKENVIYKKKSHTKICSFTVHPVEPLFWKNVHSNPHLQVCLEPSLNWPAARFPRCFLCSEQQHRFASICVLPSLLFSSTSFPQWLRFFRCVAYFLVRSDLCFQLFKLLFSRVILGPTKCYKS